MAFGGNPNVTITAIGVVGGIVLSRAGTLTTPAFIQASASAITATGTSYPYQNLEYSWDFGDPSGTETFTAPIDATGLKYAATTVNMNNGQTGPEASYVYRSAGTYTITLTIRGQNGAGFTTATATTSVTVSAFAPTNTYYFDLSAGVNGAGTFASPYNSLSSLQTLLNATVNNTLFVFKRGTTNTDTATAIDWSHNACSVVRFDAYDASNVIGSGGSGAKPIIQLNSGTASIFLISNGGSGSGANKSDIVFSNLDWRMGGTFNGTTALFLQTQNATATLSDVYLDNVDTQILADLPVANLVPFDTFGTKFTNFGVWGGNHKGITNASPTNRMSAILGSSNNWSFFTGFYVNGDSSNTTPQQHHLYPKVNTHYLVSYVRFGHGQGRFFCINTDFDVSTTNNKYICIRNNDFNADGGTNTANYAHDLDNVNNDSTTQVNDVVAQQNAYGGLTGVSYPQVTLATAISYTLRDNLCWNCDWFVGAPIQTLGTNIFIYRNYVYQDWVGVFPNAVIDLTTTGNAASGAFTTPVHFQFTDNNYYIVTSGGSAFNSIIANMTGSTIDRNKYYITGATNGILNNGSAITFATWQVDGYDAAGSYSNVAPNWIGPAAGDFSTTGAHGGGKRLGRF